MTCFPTALVHPRSGRANPDSFTLDAIREQPALAFLTAPRTPVTPQSDEPVLVALLAETSDIPPIQMRDRVVAGWPLNRQPEASLGDDVSHATAVAAIIAALAPTAQILPIRVLGGPGGLGDIQAGLRVALERGADIVIMPFGVNLEGTDITPPARARHTRFEGSGERCPSHRSSGKHRIRARRVPGVPCRSPQCRKPRCGGQPRPPSPRLVPTSTCSRRASTSPASIRWGTNSG